MANSYPASGQVILDDLKVCTSARLQPHFVSYGEHMFMNLESAHNNSYLPVVTFSRAGCTLGAIGLERASNSDTVGNYAESEMIIGTRANTPTSIQTNGVRRINIASGGNVSIGAASPFVAPKVDIRTSCPLTSEVGQPLFLGSNDVTGPLGVVIQHLCGHGVCRVDITSTRYGVSGNDLSLNVDSSNPNTGGGLYIKYRGNVGIGTAEPIARFHVEQSTTGEVGRFRANVAGCADVVIVNNAQTWGFRVDNAASNAFHLRNFQNSTNIMTLATGGNVGVGTTSPRYRLDVDGGAMSNFYMSCCNSTLDGTGPYDYGIIGTGDRAGALVINDIVGARYSFHAGSYNLTFRKSVRNTVGECVYCTVMQFVGTTDTNCITNVSITHRLGIGTTSPSYGLHVNGTFYAAGSSADYKQDVCQYNTDSCMFMKLNPVTYQYKEQYCHLGKELKSGTQIGLIAEDVAEVYPELAILVNEDDNKVVRNVDYEKLSIILLSEVQKLRKEVDNIKNNK
jgi:hypothetical protein